jgi:TRAP-type C4-dicarboxylate transport system permease large subunit
MSVGMGRVQFGVVSLLNIMIGAIAPPVGTTKYGGVVLGKISIGQSAREGAPFIIALMIALFLVTCLPWLVLRFPNLLRPAK